jgi:hypothetical protein
LKLRRTSYGFLAAAALGLSVAAIAGQAKTVKGGETGLVGVKLYDTGTRVISLYGNPTEIQPVGVGGDQAGPSGGGPGGNPGGRPGVGGPGGPGGAGPGGGGGAASPSAASSHAPSMGFGFGDELLRQRGRGGLEGEFEGGGGPPGPGPVGGGGGGQPGLGMPGGGAGAPSGKILYTRWVYKRGASKYGFIIDKFNRVVQVEAIGLSDPKVRTSKGIRLGSTFADVMKKYQTPDGYEISGDNIVVRYLVRNKVAFRLSRLADKRPHVVTGVVVAGGKT